MKWRFTLTAHGRDGPERRYAYRPEVTISGGKMAVEGMSRPISVRRL